jgi:choline dehydrogenase-like flavoprotein
VADVVVVGAGPGRLAAAFEASGARASVLLLEAGDAIGGNDPLSRAYLALVDIHDQRPEPLAYYICDGPAAKRKERFVAHIDGVRTAANIEGLARLIGCGDSALQRLTNGTGSSGPKRTATGKPVASYYPMAAWEFSSPNSTS